MTAEKPAAKRNLRVVEDDKVHEPEVVKTAAAEPDVRPPVAAGSVQTTQINVLGTTEAGVVASDVLPGGTQVLALPGAVGAGGLTGVRAARSLRGATIGAGTHVALLGLYGALMGEGRLSTTSRIVYAALGVAAAAGTGWMVYRTR